MYLYLFLAIMAKRRRELVASLVCLYLCCILVFYLYSALFPWASTSLSTLADTDEESKTLYLHRKLLSLHKSHASSVDEKSNCTPPDIEQFPKPFMNYGVRRNGGLIVHIFVSLYMFLGLSIICDEYFVPSLEKMCKLLNIQSDVAGATFMAAGSSAPELATAVIAVFIAKDDIGIGTVVGSAVYNIAFVIGICGLFAGRDIYLKWWPMFRDCVFYLISILALLFALRDENVTWVESVLFLSLYTLYILFMFINRRVEEWLTGFKCFARFGCRLTEPVIGVSYHPLPNMAQACLENGTSDKTFHGSNSDFLSTTESPTHSDDEENSVFSAPTGVVRKSLWIVSLPLLFFCYFTIPDCRRSRWEKWFFATFLSACVWISVLSYILVWMITIIGYTLHIRDTIMGLTFLAAGASIPDAISSLIVARDGLGDMAVSNAVGSNVFDILLCLGLPWFLQTVVVEPGSTIPVRSKGLTYSTLTLLLTVVFLLFATHLNNWKLDKRYGVILLAWYLLFMVVATIYESSWFGNLTLPTCPSDF
ncbi:probable sodium/potassium/calcium exchanger CG1090 isoform X2 [Uloborus diversus]|uniref:probable sodium/potassium/calcium exchanger CG1090 isoform X2 n=2 Tax=Uloborus diversus TaxID=327109 RepID=UPI0024094261|nr:probable sodium/potassium/calcium exchanger CG1090 isoform X2 [Uloborus diversus]